MDRVTFATSSGIVWLALAVHFAAGLAAVVSGTIALAVAKGGRLHKQSGLVFTTAMVGLCGDRADWRGTCGGCASASSSRRARSSWGR
jgi:hypothetical protein